MCRLLGPLVALAVLASAVPLPAEETRVLGPAVSIPLHSTVDVRMLPAPSNSGPSAEPLLRVRPRYRPHPDAWREWTDSPAGSSRPAGPDPNTIADEGLEASAPSPRAASVVTSFEGPTNAENLALTGALVLPPDPNLGAGVDHLFQIVNIVGRISDKEGVPVSDFPLRNFFGLDPNTQETDPRVFYDAGSGRWFATYLQVSQTGSSGTSSIVLAVSESSDPTAFFCRYRIGNPTAETFVQDFPQLGVSDDKVVISFLGFAFGTDAFLGAGYYVINKADLVGCSGAPRVVRVPPDPSRFTEYPASTFSSSSALFLAMNAGSTLKVFAVSGVPGVTTVSESATTLGIRSWSPPPPAVQAGSPVRLDTGLGDVISAVWRGGSLWVAGGETCIPPGDGTTRSCLRIVEVRTNSASLKQDMTFAGVGAYYYYPAVCPDVAGNLSVVFNASSASEFPGIRTTGRYAGDFLNTLRASTLLRVGNGAQTSLSGRMGDYSGAALDPTDLSSVWVMAEYIRSSGPSNWGTYVGRLRFAASPLVAAVLPSSRSVQAGTPATAFVTIINAGTVTANAVGIALNAPIPAGLTYQTTNPETNAVTGSPNTPVLLAPGQSQSFVIAVTPTAPFAPVDAAFVFAGSDAPPPGPLIGINTLLVSASSTPVPDVVALAATPTNDGVLSIPAGPDGSAAFAVATVNVGAASQLTVSADTGAASLPISLALCQTSPATGLCSSVLAPSVTIQMNAGDMSTFSFFLTAGGSIPFDAAANRIFVRFKDAGGATRGSTSVAVRSP